MYAHEFRQDTQRPNLLDIVGVAEGCVTRGGGTIVIVAHVILVDVGALHAIDVAAHTHPSGTDGLGRVTTAGKSVYTRVPEVVEVVVHERASVVLEVDPVVVAVRAVVLPDRHRCSVRSTIAN